MSALSKWVCSPKLSCLTNLPSLPTVLPNPLQHLIMCLEFTYYANCLLLLKMQISPRTYMYGVVTCPEKPALGGFPEVCFASHPLCCSIGSHVRAGWDISKDEEKKAGGIERSINFICANRLPRGRVPCVSTMVPMKTKEKHSQMLGHWETASSFPLNCCCHWKSREELCIFIFWAFSDVKLFPFEFSFPT